MSPEAHQRVRQLFDEAMERPEAERTAFLLMACAGDAALYREVSQLLAAQAQAGNFLEKEPARPQRIGRYLIKGELGRGAMGIVYDAVDPLIGRRVAVKVIRLGSLLDGTDATVMRERLFREARSAGSLFHPGIVVILDVGQDRDVAFIAMECVEGPSLYQVMAKQRVARAESLRILKEIAAALDYAHGHGVVHRDIKPANVMLDKGVTVKVADFGIAKITSAAHQTQTSTAMGTPSYMSPEQMDAKPLDGKADQFSLAVVAYELLTGSKPFLAESLSGLAYTIVHGNRPSAHAANPGLPAGIDDVLRRGLARLPEERYPTCCEFVGALEGVLAGVPAAVAAPPPPPAEEPTARTPTPATAPPPPVPPATAQPRKSTKYVVAGVVGIAVLVGAGVAYKFLGNKPASPPPAKEPPVVQQPVQPPVSPPAAEIPSATPPANTLPVPTEPNPPVPTKLEESKTGGTPPPPVGPLQLYMQGQSKLANGQTAEGLALLHQAADLGDTKAMIALGDYAATDTRGHLPDEGQAFQWYRKSADAGDRDGMLHLGVAYDTGSGVRANDEQAVLWYRRAADKGNASAAFNLGEHYENGKGVPKDMPEACTLYQRAAKGGNADAKAKLGGVCGR